MNYGPPIKIGILSRHKFPRVCDGLVGNFPMQSPTSFPGSLALGGKMRDPGNEVV